MPGVLHPNMNVSCCSSLVPCIKLSPSLTVALSVCLGTGLSLLPFYPDIKPVGSEGESIPSTARRRRRSSTIYVSSRCKCQTSSVRCHSEDPGGGCQDSFTSDLAWLVGRSIHTVCQWHLFRSLAHKIAAHNHGVHACLGPVARNALLGTPPGSEKSSCGDLVCPHHV